jgi:DNA invertase Pin-like site-specific DNA recombinase
MCRVIAYVRVSTDKQEMDNQRHEITTYATREGFVVGTWIETEVSSRKSPKARHLDELLDMVKRGDILIVSELSRIGRSIRENLNTLHELGRKGVTTHIVKQGLRTNGKNDVLATMLLANISFAAELERDLISQRTKSALARKKAEGVKLGNPKLSEVHKVQDSVAQAHAEQVRPIINELSRQGLSQRAIVDELNRMGVQTARNGKWRLLTLQRALNRLK